MRILLPAAYLLGLVMKILHLPYHTLFLLVVLALWLVIGLRAPWRGVDRVYALADLATWSWLLHLLFVLKLLPYRSITLIMAISLTVLAVALMARERLLDRGAARMLSGAVIAVLLVMSVPTATRYHTTNLAFSVERDTDVRSWDKYSFLLLREGRSEEALRANERALVMAKEMGKEPWIAALSVRADRIASGSWEAFRPLPH